MKKSRIIFSLLLGMSILSVNPVSIYATEINSVETTETAENDTKENTISVTSVKLNKSDIVINQGDTLTLKDTILPSNADDKSVTWNSSNTDVAKVDESGEVKYTTYGTTVITCTANDGSGKHDKCKVTVYSPFGMLNAKNKDNTDMEIYSDNNYDSDKIVNEFQNRKTYYAKASSDSISINIKKLDESYFKVFKATSYTDYGNVKTATLVNNNDISLSSGTTTLIIRVYSQKPDSSVKYKDDNTVLDQYQIKVELNK